MRKSYNNKSGISITMFTALVAIYFSVVMNVTFYKELKSIFSSIEEVKAGFVISIPLFLFFALNIIFSLFSWPRITKPFFVILVILSSMVCYAEYNYGVMFDKDMITNIVETDAGEASAYLSFYALVWVLAIGVTPAIFIMRCTIQPAGKMWLPLLRDKLISIIVSLISLAIIFVFYYQDYASVGRNNSYLRKLIIPTQYVYSLSGYVKDQYFSSPIPYVKLGEDAKQSDLAIHQSLDKPSVFIFVVGETARSQNYQVNGYGRKTNPYTAEQGIISFQDVDSCGTATAISVPCMFSNLSHHTFDRDIAEHQDNVLDVLKRAGVDVLWKDNDGGDKGVAKNVKYIEIDRRGNNKFCNGSTCYDMALVESIGKDIDEMKGNRMIFLHLIGSHGPTYFQRYPKDMAYFQPDCARSDIENCERETIINSYDNTIRYTDYVLSKVIETLKEKSDQYNTAMMYVSDHGESLGENGVYLHGLPYRFAPDYQKKVPLMVWLSDGFKQAKSINASCLREKAMEAGHYSHDNIFHSLLGVMDIETRVYQPDNDIFSSCRMP
ncbi:MULTISPECIES: phosphoethanolamine transferase [unclassified Salinivibrio]|uniref:phosphoethanolamine transferase n=1 Tax=unclassified Salinivibrio TaxID=2636825 RepID=UPI00098597A0|nr:MULTISPECIES: phosphoethanolamine--lipid A transferase [unclassified Salinivibrio]OOF14191.1 phosphoethanolamine transferase [Salinivibrio sp. PR932]OOF14770.1 phosphoethanolamine transferase [Salinivibrio sp. PR919]